MRNKKNRLSSIVIAIILLVSASCGTHEEKKKSVSDMLDQSLSSVFTIKVSENKGSKTAFGYADSGDENKSKISEIAYATELNLDGTKTSGSGFIIHSNNKNYLITNAHVIESAIDINKDVTAVSYDRKEHKVHFVGADSFYDIAVFEVTEPLDSSIVPLSFSTENYRIGQKVFAIGNPLGYYPYTVTEGIISAINRPGTSAKSGYLQSSATLSHGNSGGPLINETGELMGVNTLGVDKNNQLNFALESKILERILTDIISKGRVERAFFGLEICQDYKYVETDKGDYKLIWLDEKPRINAIIPNSPASKTLSSAENTFITSVNGEEVNSLSDLTTIFEKTKPGETLKLGLQTQNGARSEASIISNTLSEVKLEELAKYYFMHHYNIELTKNESGVILNFPTGFQEQSFQFWDKNAGRFQGFRPEGDKLYILSCGNFYDKDDYDFWDIKTYKDLGSTLRLASMAGNISFLANNGKQAYVIKITLKSKEDVIGKTLLY